MIFILVEEFFNGTVTASRTVSGIEADTFEEAVSKLEALLGTKELNYEIKQDTPEEFTYSILGQMLYGYGRIKSEPLDIIA